MNQINQLCQIYFSPKGSTKKIINLMGKQFFLPSKKLNLLDKSFQLPRFTERDLVLIGLPVYSGRIPTYCKDKLKMIEGNNATAIPIVSYGNRDYDDALLELSDLLKDNGFSILGAAAFVCEHSIFTDVATNRPDKNDEDIIVSFTKKCIGKLDNSNNNNLNIKGNRPYRDISDVPLKPKGNRHCIDCYKCIEICPRNAIPEINPRKTLDDKYMSCGACIAVCPNNSRGYGGIIYAIASKKFQIDNSERLEPDIFL